jgi:F-type H+-transporting ATPase subunit gamma
MPSLIDIRRRIRSVKNTQQITKAMKMVSAAKLRRAQEHVIAARPYSVMLKEMMADLAAAAASDQDAAASPMLTVREEKRIQLILITADTGLAGAFNSNLLKAAFQFYKENKGKDIEVIAIGRKGRDAAKKGGYKIVAEHIGIIGKAQASDAAEIAKDTIDRYAKGEIDAVYLLNNEFKSVLAQTVVMRKIFPFTLPVQQDSRKEIPDFIFEQPPLEMLENLLPRYFQGEVFRALLETFAAYHAARMTAMDSATTNAKEMIETLTLNMNRVRQASITREIIEVVSGASAAE